MRLNLSPRPNARSAYDDVVPAHGKACVKTDLAIKVPHGTYGRVAPRSGLAAKHFIDTGAGVIDEDYRGNVMVLLFNHSDVDFQSEYMGTEAHAGRHAPMQHKLPPPQPSPSLPLAVKKGDRIAQLVLERIATPEVVEVQELDNSERGAGGFGSTGGFTKQS
jgi:dUTP pyrophosphatase